MQISSQLRFLVNLNDLAGSSVVKYGRKLKIWNQMAFKLLILKRVYHTFKKIFENNILEIVNK